MLIRIILLTIFFYTCRNFLIAHNWGGVDLSIVGSDVIHMSESELASTTQFIRSREFLLPAETITYSEGDMVRKIFM